MAKDITILEGSTSKSFSNVNKIRVNNVGGGTSDWVPEDETQLTTKHINENGTYTASDDGYYGYSEVTVNGIGGISYTAGEGDSIGGVDLTEGNEYEISVDEETGVAVVEELPSYIAVAHQPDKTSYVDGEAIDIDGLVIQAYTADGETWSNEDYPSGTIPANELVIDPTAADYSDSTQNSEAISELETGLSQPIPFRSGSGTFSGPDTLTGEIVASDNARYTFVKQMDGRITVFIVSGTPGAYVSFISRFTNGWGQQDEQTLTYYARTSHTYNDRTVYYSENVVNSIVSGWRTPTDLSPIIDIVPEDYYGDWRSAWTMVYGSITYAGVETIDVNWNRPSDGKLLNTSFDISVEETVVEESETAGGESSSESGSGGGYSF